MPYSVVPHDGKYLRLDRKNQNLVWTIAYESDKKLFSSVPCFFRDFARTINHFPFQCLVLANSRYCIVVFRNRKDCSRNEHSFCSVFIANRKIRHASSNLRSWVVV